MKFRGSIPLKDPLLLKLVSVRGVSNSFISLSTIFFYLSFKGRITEVTRRHSRLTLTLTLTVHSLTLALKIPDSAVLAAVREGSVRVRPAVDRAARVGHGLAGAPRDDAHHGEDHGQHQAEAGDRYGNGEAPLGHADGVVRGLKKVNITQF